MFVPFVNDEYTNNWAQHLLLATAPDGDAPEPALAPGAVDRFYRRKSRWYRHRCRISRLLFPGNIESTGIDHIRFHGF